MRNAMFRHYSPYTAILPYNLNWMVSTRLLPKCTLTPITVVDVGCRGGLPDELYPLRNMIHHIGFDADVQECKRINSQPHDLFCRDTFPIFIGSQNTESDFHFFKSLGESSALPPDARFTSLFGSSDFAIERTIRVETTTLDTFFQSNLTLPRPDMLKLDTQGTELEILKGSEDCLRTTCLVEVEVEFLHIYKGQALFEDVLAFMRSHGFDLLYLNRVFKQRKGYRG